MSDPILTYTTGRIGTKSGPRGAETPGGQDDHRWRVIDMAQRTVRDLPEAIAAKISEDSSGCWLWGGPYGRDGYGRAYRDKRMWAAHRLTYTLLVGTIPDGFQVDHLCRVKTCVNPDHLEPVTPSENVRRERDSRTHCPQGHPRVPENIYTYQGQRKCRICRNARSAEYRRNKGRVQRAAYMRAWRKKRRNG